MAIRVQTLLPFKEQVNIAGPNIQNPIGESAVTDLAILIRLHIGHLKPPRIRRQAVAQPAGAAAIGIGGV